MSGAPSLLSATIGLNSGWNLISSPIVPTDNAIGNMLGALAGKYSVVWAYQNNLWHMYDPANPGFSDLTTMEAGWGYWIKMTQAGSLNMSGTAASKTMSLLAGWNLVGYNSTTSQSIANALASIVDKVDVVWSYQNGAWKMYDPANPGFSDLNTMDSGYGYWIKTKQACTWTLP